MIQFHQVSKQYGATEALKNVSLDVAAGELVFLTGHSGAGKTTLLRLIALIERQSSGQILVGGQNIARLRAAQVPLYRRHLGFIGQNPKLLLDRTVFDNIALPLVIGGVSHTEITKRVRGALEQVGLLARERSSPSGLSAGEQQRVAIARAVVNRPSVLLADEPTGNLDPMLSREVMQLFERFHQFGTTIIVVTHSLDLLKRFRHRILSLKNGSFGH